MLITANMLIIWINKCWGNRSKICAFGFVGGEFDVPASGVSSGVAVPLLHAGLLFFLLLVHAIDYHDRSHNH